MLSTMGIANPVTKKAAGAQYHHDLARQLADFLDSDQLLRRPRAQQRRERVHRRAGSESVWWQRPPTV